MNLNLIGYCIYLIITGIIILKVGKICYQNGNIFVAALIPNHKEIGTQTNQILLLGYYLLNLGYCAMTLVSWQVITTYSQLIELIASKTATIILVIALMHYINIITITKFIKKLI
ncbi:hypothetical protein HNQ02_002547 [Flavobacterium sp. 7E]|uniref:hypothetical protein n=1 Tax=Flavobacterium sp. 7E TaxID=2735898 RepID=UPI00157034CB|nr:hypothetical protein [Flavobacterium sp. 7E]NRS89616.1 hypothetical protein [Flavobacterium sp. 7E]